MAVSPAAAAVRAGWRAEVPRAGAFAARHLDAVRLTYAQLVFSRDRSVGALLLLATALAPSRGLTGLLSVLLALATARALALAPELIDGGQLSYNALMLGLAVAAHAPPSPASVALLAAAVVASVGVSVALHGLLGVGHGLPSLTLPFLAVYYALLGALPPAHAVAWSTPDLLASLSPTGVPGAFLRSLGALLCVPRADAGAVVLAALLVHSRIAGALCVTAFSCCFTLAARHLGADAPLALTAGLNGMLVAVALGAVWFIPSVASYAVGLVGALVTGAVSVGLAARFERMGLPVLITPFNLAVPLALLVLRQRVADAAPHAVDFAPGTPEQNLGYFLSRLERFGAVLGHRLTTPFLGRWTCTQGVNGGVTHEGPWRHALDFEVLDDDGRALRAPGTSLDDCGCYRLPVVAAAAGVVARVIDGVRDNPLGEVNLDTPWGNAVILYHSPGLYSCVAHLSPGSITVREGQSVQAGERLGLCGNSGRSATPHLHFQLQATAELGAATLPLALHDVVSGASARPTLVSSHLPSQGEAVRALVPDPERAALVRFAYGRTMVLREHSGRRADERLVADIDLLGRTVLRAPDSGAALYYTHTPAGFSVHDVIGPARSVLHLVRAALSRVPFDAEEALAWVDRVPVRPLLPVWLRPLLDVAMPLGLPSSFAMRYRAARQGFGLRVEGRSERLGRDGRPWVTTVAHFAPEVGLVRLELTLLGRVRRFEIAPAAEAPRPSPSALVFTT